MTEINLSDISIGFIGLGKLGLPCAEVFAQHHPVYGYDVVDYNSSVINKCEDIESVVKQSDYVFIAVPTPHAPGYGGETPTSHLKPTDFDYGIVDSVIKEAVKYTADTDTVLVLISTVLPGTISERWQDDLKGTTFIYNPYLIAMGTVAHDMVNPEMIMIGTADGETTDQAEVLAAMYKNMAEVDNLRIEYGTHTEIEALKVFYNTWITMKVTLCNMVQDVANAAGNMNVDVVTGALARSDLRIMSDKYMTAGMGDGGGCHPRDNIALSQMSSKYNLGYDMFGALIKAREEQARNMAEFLMQYDMPVVIVGKAYKPAVPYCEGSPSLLVGHYLEEKGTELYYIDSLASRTQPKNFLNKKVVYLLAHSYDVTYHKQKAATEDSAQVLYISPGSVVVDPWRKFKSIDDRVTVVHYGDTRAKSL